GSLAHVQGLRADLSDVVDPHQARGVAPLGIVHRGVRYGVARGMACGLGGAGDGFHGAFQPAQQAVEGTQGANGHGRLLTYGYRTGYNGRLPNPDEDAAAACRGSRSGTGTACERAP